MPSTAEPHPGSFKKLNDSFPPYPYQPTNLPPANTDIQLPAFPLSYSFSSLGIAIFEAVEPLIMIFQINNTDKK